MKFLVDAQLPPLLARWIAEHGHPAEHVSAVELLNAEDRKIAEIAEAQGYAVISKDEDFALHRLPDRFAFVWLRIGNATNRRLIDWVVPRWPILIGMLERGERLVELR